MHPGEPQGWAAPGAGHQLMRSDVFCEFLWVHGWGGYHQGKPEMWISGAFASSVPHKFTRMTGRACQHSPGTGYVVSSGKGLSKKGAQEPQVGVIKPLPFPGDVTQALRRWEPSAEGSSSPTFCPCCAPSQHRPG